ncbi:MAG: molybdopterin-dependent oxidoreductase [Deltaproteobacteria bacterium]|nr:molybdopterin-dependent oxidoreductase [Deltaproteobacteria bacterium]
MPIITACSQDCPDTCSLVVETSPSGRVLIKGNPDHPFTAGFCCAKIKSWHRRLNSPSRITAPLMRDGTGWRAIGWDEALEICAARIRALRAEPLSILHLDSSGNMGLMVQVPQHFFNLLGASRASGGLCASAGLAACQADFGKVEHNEPGDLLNARVVVNWGRDIARTSVHLAALVKKARKKNTRVLTISPGGDGHEAWTDEFIRVRPGQDRFLAAAVCRTLIEGGHTIAGIDDVAANWLAFRKVVMAQPAREMAKACGVGQAEVERLAEVYGSGEPVATLIGWGLQRHIYGAENVRFTNALALLAGHIGRSGGGSYYIAPSTRHLDLGWLSKPVPDQCNRFFKPTIGRDILAADPAVKMIWANGTNPVNQAPDSHQVARAFRSVPFKVVVDAFMTDTAELADLILPCTLNLEQENLNPSYFHDFINYARPAFTPPACARSDHWILTQVGRRLNPPIDLPLMEELIAASLPSAAGVGLEELRRTGYVQIKRPAVSFEGMHFAHPDGRYRFPEELHIDPPAPDGYPLRLLSLIRSEAIHSQMLPEDHIHPPKVYLAADSPSWSNLKSSQPVFMVSPLGRLEVQLVELPGLYADVVVYRRGDWLKLGGGANQLIADVATDHGSGAAYYAQHVRLEN